MMKKVLKLMLLSCVIFSQISSPVKVIAEEIISDIPVIESIDVTGNEDMDELTVKIDGNNILEQTDDDLPLETRYIVKTLLKFIFVNNEEVETSIYTIAKGSDINLGNVNVNLDNIGYGYNGKYIVEVMLYDVTGVHLTDENSDSLAKYLEENKLSEVTVGNKEIVEDEIDTELYVELEGNFEETECIINPDNPNNTLTCYKITDNGIINFDISIAKGDLSNTIIEEGFYKVVINDSLTLYPYNFKLEQDFTKLLKGEYTFDFYFINEKNEIELRKSIKIDNAVGIEDYKTYFTGNEDIYNKVISSTTLNEEEKAELTNIDFNKMIQMVTVDDIDDKVDGNYFFDDYSEETISIIYRLEGIFDDNDNASNKVTDYLNAVTSDEYFKDFLVSITDKNGNLVDSNSVLATGMKLNLTYGDATLIYNFVISGDTDDGIVGKSDVNTAINYALGLELLDAINMYALDVNDDNNVDLLDITMIAGSISNKGWVTSNSNDSVINSSLEENFFNEDVIRVGDTFKVDYILTGFNDNNISLNGIEGIVDYDRDVLELVGISANNYLNEYNNYNYETGKYMYVGSDILDKDSVVLTLTFKAKMEQTTTIRVTNEKAAFDGQNITLVNNSTIDVKIERALSTNNDITSLTPSIGTFDKSFSKDELEYTLYVDYWVNKVSLNGVLGDKYASTLGFKEYMLTGDRTIIAIPVVAEDGSIKSYTITVVKVYPKSSNNYLSKLEIEGYEIEFNKDTLEYNIKVSSDVNTLDITAVAEDSSARVNIYGNNNFKEGENTVTVVVTAEDGSEKTYTITVDKEVKKEVVDEEDKAEEETNNSQLEKTVIIILIILVIIGLLYLIFKKDDEDDIIVTSNNKK